MIPNLPTDNLYKFIFVAGIALSLFGIYSYTTLSDTYIEQKAKSDIDRQIVEVLFKNIDSPIKRTFIDTGLANQMENNLIDLPNMAYKHWLEAETNIVAYPVKLNRSMICIQLGLIMAIIGGALWYFKVQRYQDTLLRSQVIESTSDKNVYHFRLVDVVIIILLLITIYLFLHNKILKYAFGKDSQLYL